MQIECIITDDDFTQNVAKGWYSSVTDPFELEILCDNVQLRYSELMVANASIQQTRTFWDGHPLEQTAGTTLVTPGAILPTVNIAMYNKTGSLYYWTETPEHLLYRRWLTFFAYYSMAPDNTLLPAWVTYFEDKLHDFYTNTDYVLKSKHYEPLSFHHLSNKITHRKGFRYPHTFAKWYPN